LFGYSFILNALCLCLSLSSFFCLKKVFPGSLRGPLIFPVSFWQVDGTTGATEWWEICNGKCGNTQQMFWPPWRLPRYGENYGTKLRKKTRCQTLKSPKKTHINLTNWYRLKRSKANWFDFSIINNKGIRIKSYLIVVIFFSYRFLKSSTKSHPKCFSVFVPAHSLTARK